MSEEKPRIIKLFYSSSFKTRVNKAETYYSGNIIYTIQTDPFFRIGEIPDRKSTEWSQNLLYSNANAFRE